VENLSVPERNFPLGFSTLLTSSTFIFRRSMVRSFIRVFRENGFEVSFSSCNFSGMDFEKLMIGRSDCE